MERLDWISRFIRRMTQLDASLRPAELAELASHRFEADPSAEPEASAEEAGRGHVRRVD